MATTRVGRWVELDGACLASVDHALKILLRVGLSLAIGTPIGLLIRVRGQALSNARAARTLAVACRTRLPEACAIALVPAQTDGVPFAEDFAAYTALARGGEVRIFWSMRAARVWLGVAVGPRALPRTA